MLDYLGDLESDFSVFHRVEAMTELDPRRFFRLAVRLAAYQGVLAARVMEQQQPENQSGAGSAAPVGRHYSPDRMVAPTRDAIEADPILSGIVSFGGG